MIKICIVEDSDTDLVNRYSSLTKDPTNEIDVVLYCPYFYQKEDLAKEGFNPERIRDIDFADWWGKDSFPDSDIYFCDGLKGHCFSVADTLGKERVWINSEDGSVNKKSREKGYQTVTEPLTDIVERHKKR